MNGKLCNNTYMSKLQKLIVCTKNN